MNATKCNPRCSKMPNRGTTSVATTPIARFYERVDRLFLSFEVWPVLAEMYMHGTLEECDDHLPDALGEMVNLVEDHPELVSFLAETINDLPVDGATTGLVTALIDVVGCIIVNDGSFGHATGLLIKGLAKHLPTWQNGSEGCLTVLAKKFPRLVTKALCQAVRRNPEVRERVVKILVQSGIDTKVIRPDCQSRPRGASRAEDRNAQGTEKCR